MTNSDLLLSQLPFMGEYIDVSRSYWQMSRHPENIREIIDVGRESQEEFTFKEKALLVGTTALTLAQQLPVNEILVGLGVGATLKATGGNIPASIAAAGAITGSAEVGSGMGMAYSLEKFRPSVDIISDRYINKQKIAEKAEKRALRGKNPSSELGRTYAAASIVLTSGTVVYEALRDRSRTIQDNIRTAKIASAMVVANYCTVSGIVVGGAGVAEKLGVKDALTTLQELIGNPVIMGTFVSSIFGIAKMKEFYNLKNKIDSSDSPNRSIIKDRLKSFFYNRSSKENIAEVSEEGL